MDGLLRVNLPTLKGIDFKTFFLSFIPYKNLIFRPGMRCPTFTTVHVGQCRIHCVVLFFLINFSWWESLPER